MKVLFLCGLIMAAAMFVEAGHEICEKDHDQVKALLTCMAEHVPAEVKEKAMDIIHKQGDNAAEFVKKQCEVGVDFVEVLKKVLTEEEAAAIRKAYKDCHA
ncbi:antimicrobial peptide microplusin-like [Haemaphysalis longicornis]